MKKLLWVLVLLPLLSGCWIKGQGSTVGYVTTVETDCIIWDWDKVWFRVETGTMSSMQSQPEQYAIRKSNTELKQQLLDTAKKHQKIELKYQQHIVCVASSHDEVIGFEVIN